MRTIITAFLVALQLNSLAQNTSLQVGDKFPDIVIRNIVNAPVKTMDVFADNNKYLILNFWGTWCSPCIPEMDHLAKLQQNNPGIRVIGISDDKPDRLHNYLKQRPSALWLATDTSYFLYNLFGFTSVGQAAVINPAGKIVALVKTDSINQSFIHDLLQGKPVASSAELKVESVKTGDIFNVDSTTQYQLTYGSYRIGVRSQSHTYRNSAVFDGRRRSYINLCPGSMYRDAFGIQHHSQVIYEPSEKEICDFNDKSTLICLDLIVKPELKDSFIVILQQTLNKILPVKGRVEKRTKPVYVLHRKDDAAYTWETSKGEESLWGFSGRGFTGKNIPLKHFVDYLANELDLPVIDETGLTGNYDIKTDILMRTAANTLESIDKLGLKVEKETREIEVLILSRPSPSRVKHSN